MLNEITAALEKAFPELPVYYGSSAEATGKKIYDYIVFYRERMSWKNGSMGDPSVYYKVALVHQNYIPEDEQTTVIDALRGIPGLKESGDVSFDYMTQPGTQLALEAAIYTFVAARKRLPARVVTSDG